MTLWTIAKRGWNIKLGVQLKPNQFFFSNFFHMWQSSHKRFNMSDNDPIEGLTLMVKRFKKALKTIKKIIEKFPYVIKI